MKRIEPDSTGRRRRFPLVNVPAAVLVLSVACTSSPSPPPSSAPASSGAGSTTATPVPPSGGQSYADHGVSFSYPTGWRAMDLADTSASIGSFDWSETVGVDPRNLVAVSAATIPEAVTSTSVGARAHAFGLQVQSLFTQAGGSMTNGPTVTDVGGLPALRFEGDARTPAGAPVHTRLVLVFDGTTEYELACQYDDAGRSALLPGCDRVLSTFAVTG